MPRVIRGLIVAFALIAGLPATGEIYRWVDATGKMHFTQDLARVPAGQRAAAKARAEAPAKASRAKVQHYTPPAPPARVGTTARKQASPASGKVHRIRVQRAGPSMMVEVRINGQLDVPFIIDTGATDVVLPMWAAKELGLEVSGPGVRTSPRQTANGVIHAPVVMLDSVELGTASVEDVGGLALVNMSKGLLGLSFFNHFTYNIDAAQGLVTLSENSLAEEGVLRGGRGQSQWTSEFRAAQQMIELAESRIDEVPFGRVRQREKAEEAHQLAIERLRLLEQEADEARVPFGWRN